jgi:hypothetical protein
MMQLTMRDELMLDWLSVVRMADMDAIRWALGGLRDDSRGEPVTVRRANQWIARMAGAEVVDRFRPVYRDRQIVWPTRKGTGQTPPMLFRQTMRHELAVAAVSARYLAHGFRWARDVNPSGIHGHQADGSRRRARSSKSSKLS